MNKQEIRVIAGVTNDDEIYFIELSNAEHFSMSGFTIRPLTLEDAQQQSYESIRNIIEDETRDIRDLYLRDIDEITQEIIDSDRNLCGIDTSLYPETIEVDGQEYVFASSACGQHQEKELKKYFIDKTDYAVLLSLWDKYHLKKIDIEKDLTDIEKRVYQKMLGLGYYKSDKTQNKEVLIKEAVCFINNQEA